jgi:hypothetical protein
MASSVIDVDGNRIEVLLVADCSRLLTKLWGVGILASGRRL